MLLCRLSYVLSRGFKEFKSLYKIKPDIIHGVSRLLPDKFNDAYDDCRQTLLESMVLPLAENPHLIKRIFKKIPLLLEYEEDIFRYYEVNLDTSKWREFPKMDPHTFFNEQISVLELSKADLYVEGKENAKALPYFIKALRNYYQLSQFVEASSAKSAQEIEEELDVLSMKKLKMLKVIVKILKELPGDENFNPRQEALNLCQNGRLID
jgi:tRNA nucleotidyltransferase/poly(A) polymerase